MVTVRTAGALLPAGSVLGYLEQKDRSPGEYLAKLLRPRTWATLLSGKVDYAGIFVGQLGRLRAFGAGDNAQAAE